MCSCKLLIRFAEGRGHQCRDSVGINAHFCFFFSVVVVVAVVPLAPRSNIPSLLSLVAVDIFPNVWPVARRRSRSLRLDFRPGD